MGFTERTLAFNNSEASLLSKGIAKKAKFAYWK